jgi:hypothetical protein
LKQAEEKTEPGYKRKGMTFNDLRDFLLKTISLSHIYKSLLVKTLIDSGGSATIWQ